MDIAPTIFAWCSSRVPSEKRGHPVLLFCGTDRAKSCGVATATLATTAVHPRTVRSDTLRGASQIHGRLLLASHPLPILSVCSLLWPRCSGDEKPHPATAAPCPGGMRPELHQVSRGPGGQPGLPCGEGGGRRCSGLVDKRARVFFLFKALFAYLRVGEVCM